MSMRHQSAPQRIVPLPAFPRVCRITHLALRIDSRSGSGQLDFGKRHQIGLGHARLKIGIGAAHDRLQALDRDMNIAIGADAVDFDEQAVDLVVGVAQNLRDVAELLAVRADEVGLRSEEHTSELQSLMRISYAVFCLKKKN